MNDQSPLDPTTLSLEFFQAHLESEFVLTAGDPAYSLKAKLTEVSAYPDHRPEELRTGRAPFSLVFDCPDAVVDSRVFRLEHGEIGTFEVFLSPFAALGQGCQLEAVFN